MVIDRRDLRVLPDGWYPFKIDSAEEVESRYGPALKMVLAVCWGRAEGARIVLQTDRFASPGNKLGRVFRCVGFDPSIELPVECKELLGRRFGGRVERYVRDGRVRAKVSAFCAIDRLEVEIADYEAARVGVDSGTSERSGGL